MTAKKRSGWSNLSPSYRKRLERSGVTRKSWESGADLRKARGHAAQSGLKQTTKKQAALTKRGVETDLTPRELKELQKITTRPKWIHKEIRTEVAASLSVLPDPKTWESVELIPRTDGQAWTMQVFRKRGKYPLEIEIPGGGGAVGEAPREVIDLLTDLSNKAGFDLFLEVMDTDRLAPKR